MENCGEPVVQIHMISGSAEEIGNNREEFLDVCGQVCSEQFGTPVKVVQISGLHTTKKLSQDGFFQMNQSDR
ncbi:hypothetical protein [Caproiciproducens sp. LBM24188]